MEDDAAAFNVGSLTTKEECVQLIEKTTIEIDARVKGIEKLKQSIIEKLRQRIKEIEQQQK